jgi:hypothetical protein
MGVLFMPKHSEAEIITAAESVCTCHEASGSVPEWLVSACRETLARSSAGLRLKFAAVLARRCPEAMRFFQDK